MRLEGIRRFEMNGDGRVSATDSDRNLSRNTKMFWIAAGVTVVLMGWFTMAFFRNEMNARDVPLELVLIGLGIIASYATHNKVMRGKCPEARPMHGEWLFISALVWAGIMISLYQGKVFERLWGMDKVAVPEEFYRFLSILVGIFGFSSIWDFFPHLIRPNNNNKNKENGNA